jgi:hypothetical protein
MTTNNTEDFVYEEQEADFDSMERGGSGAFTVTLKEGMNVYRILPPFGKEVTNPNSKFRGWIFAEHWVHWLSFKRDGGKTLFKPTLCIKYANGKDGTCPICKRYDVLVEARDTILAPFSTVNEKKERKVDWTTVPADVSEKAKKLYDAAQKIKSQRHYYYNALAQDGRVVVLKVSKTAGVDLNGEIKKCVANFNPVSLKGGCYMVLEKTKTGPNLSDVKVKASTFQTTVNDNGRILSEVKRFDLEPSIMKNAKDLYQLYARKTAEELERALAGDSTVFDRPEAPKTETATVATTVSAPVATAPIATVTNTVVSAPAVVTPAAVSASVVSAPVVATVAPVAPVSPGKSMEALMADLGLDLD